MAKIDRFTGNMFPFALGSAAAKRRVFGSSVTESDTLNANMNADYNLGWQIVDPTAGAKPPQQWFNSSMYTATAMVTYLYQQGVPEWDVAQEFFTGSITKGSDFRLYTALQDTVGNDPLVSPLDWQLSADNDFLLQDLSPNGYQILPGGLILQWGEFTALGVNGAAGTSFVLPIAFPNGFLKCVSSDGGNGALVTSCMSDGLSSIRGFGKNPAGAAPYADVFLNFWAIGN